MLSELSIVNLRHTSECFIDKYETVGTLKKSALFLLQKKGKNLALMKEVIYHRILFMSDDYDR